MPNRQMNFEDRLGVAFSHLELKELGYDYYIKLISQAMIKEICYEASRTKSISYEHYDNRQHDYCKVLDFLNELKEIAEHYEQEQKDAARRAIHAQDGQ